MPRCTPLIDPAFEALVRAMFAELNDLTPDAPIIIRPYPGTLDLLDVSGTLWDGRPKTETYRREGAEVFVTQAMGSRYRVVAGSYYTGTRARAYAAFLVR